MVYHVDGRAEAHKVAQKLHDRHGDWRKHGRLSHGDKVTGIGPTGDPSLVGSSGTGMQLDPDEFADADRVLATLRDELTEHISRATNLAVPMNDGSGPVANPMSQAFHGRATADGGLAHILTAYRNQVDQVRDAIRDTLTSYQNVEDSIISSLRVTTDQQEA